MGTQRRKLRVAIGPLVGADGGLNQHIKKLIEYSGHGPSAITPHPVFSLYPSRGRVKRHVHAALARVGFRRPDMYSLILRELFLPRFDVVHLHSGPAWPAIYLMSRLRQVKYVYSVHQIYQEEDCATETEWARKKWFNELTLAACRRANVVISIGAWQQTLLRQQDIESIYVPNGVDVEACEASSGARFRRRYQIDHDFYLFPGDIREYKRPRLFIQLAQSMPDRSFVMMGDGVTTERLERTLQVKVPENVYCLGMLGHESALDAMSACRVMVMTSKNDTCPTALLEAMACRRPVVASNSGGTADIVTHGVDGLLFEQQNLDELRRAAEAAWDLPEIGQAANQKVRRVFDWPVVSRQVDAVYEELAMGASRGEPRQRRL